MVETLVVETPIAETLVVATPMTETLVVETPMAETLVVETPRMAAVFLVVACQAVPRSLQTTLALPPPPSVLRQGASSLLLRGLGSLSSTS